MSKVSNKIRYWISRLNFHRRIAVLEQREADWRSEGREDILDHLRMGEELRVGDDTKPRIHFIHIIGSKNPGDEFCGPELYFRDLFADHVQYVHKFYGIRYDSILRDDVVVIGGGGLLECCDAWQKNINRCVERCDNVVIWGAGDNTRRGGNPPKVAIRYEDMVLVGCRDYNYRFDYLPCVSCMLPQLDLDYPIARRIGVVEHQHYSIDNFPQFEKISNETRDLRMFLRFIGQSEIIITNTYHAWYWATLMGKKVILTEEILPRKISTKFSHLRYQPTFYSGDLEADIARCETHPEALEEARALNRAFAEKVLSLLNRSGTAE